MRTYVQLLSCVLVLIIPGVARATTFVFTDNFNDYAVGLLGGQNGWIALPGHDNSVSDTLLTGTNFPKYIQTTGFLGGYTFGLGEKSLGSTYSTGTLSATTFHRLTYSNSDNAEFGFFSPTGDLVSWQLNNRFDTGINVFFTRGGEPQVGEIVGSDAALLNHWFQFNATVDLDANTLSVQIRDIDGTFVKAYNLAIGADFTASSVVLDTANGGLIAVPEPALVSMLAPLALFALRRRHS